MTPPALIWVTSDSAVSQKKARNMKGWREVLYRQWEGGVLKLDILGGRHCGANSQVALLSRHC